ncbi:MAG TPA: DUF1622 domain-containing protein [Allosphingosinicella sp.]|jgi:uncharacterized membrane protein
MVTSHSADADSLTRFIEPVATALELFGVFVIVAVTVWATWRFLFRDLKGGGVRAYELYRANLGRGILLGLEILVGADIIATVTAPLTLRSVGLLSLVVLIRTFLSFSLETEIEGRWPWRRAQAGDAKR